MLLCTLGLAGGPNWSTSAVLSTSCTFTCILYGISDPRSSSFLLWLAWLSESRGGRLEECLTVSGQWGAGARGVALGVLVYLHDADDIRDVPKVAAVNTVFWEIRKSSVRIVSIMNICQLCVVCNVTIHTWTRRCHGHRRMNNFLHTEIQYPPTTQIHEHYNTKQHTHYNTTHTQYTPGPVLEENVEPDTKERHNEFLSLSSCSLSELGDPCTVDPAKLFPHSEFRSKIFSESCKLFWSFELKLEL